VCNQDLDRVLFQAKSGVLVVFKVRLIEGSGGHIDETLIPVFAELDVPPVRNRQQARVTLTRLWPDLQCALTRAAAASAEARMHVLQAVLAPTSRRLQAREQRISRAAADDLRPCQMGLFDRRAERTIEARAARLREEAQTTGRRMADFAPQQQIRLARAPEPALMLLICR
jgi:hypothetical protein